MSPDFIAIVLIIWGFVVVLYRKSIARATIEQQNRFWGFRFEGSTFERYGFTLVGLFLIGVGIALLLA